MVYEFDRLPRVLSPRPACGCRMHTFDSVDPDLSNPAAIWPPLRRFIAGEARLGCVMARRPTTAALHELLRFGIKQGWACLFGGIAVALMIGTYRY